MAASAALPVAITARSTAKGIGDILGTDLLVIRTQRRLGKGKKAKLADVEVHVNPLNLGLTAAGVGLALWLLQLRVGTVANADGSTGYGVKERSGFLNGGAGTPTGNIAVPVLGPLAVAGVAVPWWATPFISPLATLGKIFG